MKDFFYIILTVVTFTATNWGPGPCYQPQIFEFSYEYDTVYADTCKACALQVYQVANQNQYILQIDSTGVRYISHVAYSVKKK